jgi:hypothetical protein
VQGLRSLQYGLYWECEQELLLLMLTQSELKVVANSSENYPLVFKWGWRDGPLSMKEAMVLPGYG